MEAQLSCLPTDWRLGAMGVVIGAAATAVVAWASWPPKPNAFTDSIPFAMNSINSICDYHLSGKWWLTSDDDDERTNERKRWERFVEGIDLVATAFEEASLICTKEGNKPRAVASIAEAVCEERQKQSSENKVSPFGSIGMALRSRYPGTCPGRAFLIPPAQRPRAQVDDPR